MTMGDLQIWGGGRQDHLPKFARQAVLWYKDRHGLNHVNIRMSIDTDDCDQYGSCDVEYNEKTAKDLYAIHVCGSQSLRDFIATIMHEMIHVKQWETEVWTGDGEQECEDYQYLLADEFWKSESFG